MYVVTLIYRNFHSKDYTIDRETPDHDLCKATHEELDRIAALIKEAGILVSVSY